MVKTIVFASAAVFLASAAQAETAQGFRAEALAGYDKNEIGIDDIDLNSDGIAFGLGLGYDFSLGNSVSLGVDVEASESTAKYDFSDDGFGVSINTGRDLYAGARVTFAVSEKVNFMLKAGYTNVRLKVSAFDLGDSETASGNADGFRVGSGIQYKIGSKVYLTGEYRYSGYEGDVSRQQVLVGLGYRF